MSQLASVIPLPELDRASRRSLAADAPVVSYRWLLMLCVILAGYAWFSKGFAYLGFPPIFVSELTLLCGVGWLMLFSRPQLASSMVWLLLAMCLWGTLCTLPYVSTYGIDAFRDATIFGYCAFAIVLYSYLIDDPRRLPWLIDQFRKFAIASLWITPLIWVIWQTYFDKVPNWPWSGTPVVECKGGDTMMHYGGILAFFAVGLAGSHFKFHHCALVGVIVLLAGTDSRGGLLSFLLVFAICFFWYPLNPSVWRLILVGLFGLTLMLATNARVEVADGVKRIPSGEQLISNIVSMASEKDTGDLEDTKQWRINWWTKIVNYTVYGDHFLTGKGFGISLATDDGFQGTEGPSRFTRSPHNGHLTMLARAGVPGFLLWVGVHLCWSGMILRAFFESRRNSQRTWASLFLFLFSYWLAIMVNASFDVVLENPMGGIWMWTLYGVGLGATWIHRHQPEILTDVELVV